MVPRGQRPSIRRRSMPLSFVAPRIQRKETANNHHNRCIVKNKCEDTTLTNRPGWFRNMLPPWQGNYTSCPTRSSCWKPKWPTVQPLPCFHPCCSTLAATMRRHRSCQHGRTMPVPRLQIRRRRLGIHPGCCFLIPLGIARIGLAKKKERRRRNASVARVCSLHVCVCAYLYLLLLALLLCRVSVFSKKDEETPAWRLFVPFSACLRVCIFICFRSLSLSLPLSLSVLSVFSGAHLHSIPFWRVPSRIVIFLEHYNVPKRVFLHRRAHTRNGPDTLEHVYIYTQYPCVVVTWHPVPITRNNDERTIGSFEPTTS